ncbi:LexA family protein [Gemella cuniculi]|uniref:LexA family protein n=1 Tax=Gemella cuniculi TaxID=150240 RepID=UPI0004198D08|nr:S24 family peptidase [Gemella cuniculi]
MTTVFSIRFKQCLKEKNIKQAELARSTKITPSSISDWSKGKYTPKRDKLLAIAEYLSVNPNWLVGECDNMEIESSNNFIDDDAEDIIDNISKVPILGTICAGDGVYIEEEYDDHIFIDQGMRADFALRVKGDSMIEAGIFDGDLVFIRQQNSVRNGKIAAVRLTEWNEASLKKIFVKNDNVILYPCNPDYEPIVTRNVEVIGECVGVYREL